MKVLHILNELKFSGAESLLSSAADFLREGGTQHTILTTGTNPGPFAKVLSDRGYAIVHRPLRKSPRYFASVSKFVSGGAFDVVHAHTEKANFWFGLAVLAAGSKCIRTIHNEFQFTGALRLRRCLQRQILARLGVRFVACSSRVSRNEAERYWLKTVTVDNWFDPTRISQVTPERRADARAKLSIAPDAFAIVSVGNHGPAKNHEAIIDAVKLCDPTLKVTYFHCGESGADLAARVPTTLRDRVHFQGAVSDVEIYLLACDAFVSSSFFEGGQLSLLEAAAAGVPCVTTKAGLAEVFEGLDAVTYVDPTAASVAAGLVALARKPLARRQSEGETLSAYARGRFVPELGAAKYLGLYRNIARVRR